MSIEDLFAVSFSPWPLVVLTNLIDEFRLDGDLAFPNFVIVMRPVLRLLAAQPCYRWYPVLRSIWPMVGHARGLNSRPVGLPLALQPFCQVVLPSAPRATGRG